MDLQSRWKRAVVTGKTGGIGQNTEVLDAHPANTTGFGTRTNAEVRS